MTRYPRTTLFLEGSVSVSLQFLFIRHLMPEVGSSILVTTITVSIFLLALSLGYLAGGLKTDNVRRRFSRNCLIAAFFISLGLSPLISSAFFGYLSNFHELVTLTLYCLIFMAPAVYFLGQTMPLLSNEIRARSNGELSASVLFFSTIGNVIGGLVSILILIKLFGLGVTVFVNVVVLVFLFMATTHDRIKRMIGAGIVMGIAYPMIIVAEQTLYDHTTAYGNYAIRYSDDVAIFFGNNLSQSSLNSKGEPSEYAQVAEREISRNLNPNSEILVLGAGGFTFGRQFNPEQIHFVDIDADVKDVAESLFLKSPIVGSFSAKDARIYLKRNSKEYDFILMDTFHSETAISGHLVTQEYFSLVKSRLKAGGKLVINTITSRDFEDDYSRDLHTTILSVFPYCSVQSLSTFGAPYGNRLYMCVNRSDQPHIIRDRRLEY